MILPLVLTNSRQTKNTNKNRRSQHNMKPDWMGPSATLSTGRCPFPWWGQGGLQGPFQHKPVYDSMICLQLPWAVVSINVSILLFNNGINTLVPCFNDITLFSVPLSLQSPSRGVEYAAQLVTQEENVCVFGSTTIFPLCLTTYHSRALALTLDYAQPGRTCFCKGKCCEYLSAKLSQTANQPT